MRVVSIHFIPTLIAQLKKLLSKVFVVLICAVTPRCREMTRLISVEREEPPSWFTRLRMRWHYGICVWCLRYRNQLGLLGRLSRSLDGESCHETDPRLSESSKAKMKETLTRHTHD